MSSTEKHPHIELPTVEQITKLLQGKSPVIRQIYLALHKLVLDTLPDVKYSIDCKDGQMGYAARQYGYDGWGMAALSGHSKWVSLFFMRGTDLEDPEKLLEGTGKKMRHVKLYSPDQLEEKRSTLQSLIEAAAKLNG